MIEIAYKIKNRHPILGVLIFLCMLLSFCDAQTLSTTQVNSWQTAQADVLLAQQRQLDKVEVTVVAPVKKMLKDDTEGLPHERFLIELVNGTTILVAHDTNMAPRVPLSAGAIVKIHGEYIWNNKGGVIHWTHHTDTPRHEGGWIEFNGKFYQ